MTLQNSPGPTSFPAASAGDVSKVLDEARQLLEQKRIRDDRFQLAQRVLEEALKLDPEDSRGEINALLGLACFMQQHYGDAMKHLEVAVARDPQNAEWADLLERAGRNVLTNIINPLMPVMFPDANRLLLPPARFIREPEDLKPLPSMPPGGGLVRRVLVAVVSSAASLLLDALMEAAAFSYTTGKWVNWYKRKLPSMQTLTLGGIRRWMDRHTLKSTYPGELVGHQQPGQARPPWTRRFRTANGSWNTDDPMEGAAGTEFQHQGRDEITDRKSYLNDPGLPSPREVSRQLLAAIGGRRQEAPFLNQLVIAWIQFQTHDWVSHGENKLDEVHVIPLAEDDPFRHKYGQTCLYVRKTQGPARQDGTLLYRNEVTHWWDGSQIYGSDQETQDRLRMGPEGRFMPDGHMRLDPDGSLPTHPGTGVADSGFTRNWWVGLELFHTLFVKHHNWICEELKNLPECHTWSSDQLFHTARLINTAVMAKVHSMDWTPAVLPNAAGVAGLSTNQFGLTESKVRTRDERRERTRHSLRYPSLGGLVGGTRDNKGKPYGLSELFVEAYRLHSGMMQQLRVRQIGSDHILDTVPTDATRGQGSRRLIERYGAAALFNSFGHEKMGALVHNNYPEFMTEMSIDGQAVIDLGAIDVLRARERGIPPYNKFRRVLGLVPLDRFEDFGCNAETVSRLKQLYGDDPQAIERLDLLVGTLVEAVRPTFFGFGETLHQVFIQMATRRYEADSFYTDKFDAAHYTLRGIEIVQQANLKDILTLHHPELAGTGLAFINNAFEPWGTTALTHPEEHPLTVNGEHYREGMVPRPLRLQHLPTGNVFIVDGGKVYADLDGDGKVTRHERVTDDSRGVSVKSLLAAANEFNTCFDRVAPGTPCADRDIVASGRLNKIEMRNFAGQGVAPKGRDLWAHLDYFDLNGDGKITLGDIMRGRRALGFNVKDMVLVAIGSGLMFGGLPNGLTIHIEQIQQRRPKKPTMVYDREGNIDRRRLAEYLEAFDRKGGVLTFREFRAMLAEKGSLGMLPKRQFKDLLKLCQIMNRSKTITGKQFAGFCDGSLFYKAAALKTARG